MPRKPAPPVIRIRRPCEGKGGFDLVFVSRSLGSIADTLASRYPSEEGDGDYPRGAGEDEGLAPAVAAARVEVGAWQEQRGEDAVDQVQDERVASHEERGHAEQALDEDKSGHDQ